MNWSFPLTIAPSAARQAVGHGGHTRNDRRQTHSKYAQRSAAAVLPGLISTMFFRRSRHSCMLGPTISAGIFAQCSGAQVGNDTLRVHGLTRNRTLDRIVNNRRRLCQTILAILKAKLSQCLVHMKNVRELTQTCAISLATAVPLAPPRRSVPLSQLVDEIDDDRTPGWCHDDVGGS